MLRLFDLPSRIWSIHKVDNLEVPVSRFALERYLPLSTPTWLRLAVLLWCGHEHLGKFNNWLGNPRVIGIILKLNCIPWFLHSILVGLAQ